MGGAVGSAGARRRRLSHRDEAAARGRGADRARSTSSSTAPRTSRAAARIRHFWSRPRAGGGGRADRRPAGRRARGGVLSQRVVSRRPRRPRPGAAAAGGRRLCRVDADSGRTCRAEIELRIAAAPAAYISGEDTAALALLGGGSALPTERPPYPVTEGLRRRPTAVMNVETAATLAVIFREGPEWYRELGTGIEPGHAALHAGRRDGAPGCLRGGVRHERARDARSTAAGRCARGEADPRRASRRALVGFPDGRRARRPARP